MQAMFSGILLSDNFAGAGVQVEEERENARRWRVSIAHDWRYMDLSETSLVTRVCQSDGALILSTPQVRQEDGAQIFQDANGMEYGKVSYGSGYGCMTQKHWPSIEVNRFNRLYQQTVTNLLGPRTTSQF
jgi:hypothetical protein